MLTSEILKVPTNVTWAIINPWKDNRKKFEQSIAQVRPERVRYAKRYNDSHYAMGQAHSENPLDFSKTQERNYGFLMELERTNSLGQPENYYVVVKPSAFVAPKADYDNVWADILKAEELAKQEQERQQEIRQRRDTLRRAIVQDRRAQAIPEAERLKESTIESILTVLGQRVKDRVRVSVDIAGAWTDEDSDNPQYSITQVGSVTLELQDFQRLLEKALQE